MFSTTKNNGRLITRIIITIVAVIIFIWCIYWLEKIVSNNILPVDLAPLK